MRVRLFVATMSLAGLVAGTSSAEQTLLATAAGAHYDIVANCLVAKMEPRLFAAPVVRPPPTNQAEVHLYIRGTQAVSLPVASFYIAQLDNCTTTVRFGERSDHRGKYVSAATAAAAACTH